MNRKLTWWMCASILSGCTGDAEPNESAYTPYIEENVLSLDSTDFAPRLHS